MTSGPGKYLLVAAFSLFYAFLFAPAFGQNEGGGHSQQEARKKEGFNAKEVIFGHVLNAHEFHFFDIRNDDGTKHPVSIPLPVILYSSQRGLDVFMSSKFHHGEEEYKNYIILTEEKIEELKLDPKKYSAQQIVAVNDNGDIDASVKVYDISLTRNVVQMLLALTIFVWIMIKIAKRYKKGEGVTTAPNGAQGLLEPVITFVRDEAAIPNLGHGYAKYLPFLLTLFFFILINNLFGLIPGSANVSGNIAFTLMLGIISFIVILFSSNKHYWGHIFNPPGVAFGVKLILVPVEFLGIFIKPMALIIRLFANMVAGHIIIICLISLIFIFGELKEGIGWGVSPLSVAFTIFIYFIEVLIAFIQAFVFAMLTAVFIGQAREGKHHHGEEGSATYDDAVMV